MMSFPPHAAPSRNNYLFTGNAVSSAALAAALHRAHRITWASLAATTAPARFAWQTTRIAGVCARGMA